METQLASTQLPITPIPEATVRGRLGRSILRSTTPIHQIRHQVTWASTSMVSSLRIARTWNPRRQGTRMRQSRPLRMAPCNERMCTYDRRGYGHNGLAAQRRRSDDDFYCCRTAAMIRLLRLVLLVFSIAAGLNVSVDAVASDDLAPETVVAGARTWMQLHEAYRRYGKKPDGVVAGAFTEAVSILLADHWRLSSPPGYSS